MNKSNEFKRHWHVPFFSQLVGGKMIDTCMCGAQRREIGAGIKAWHIPLTQRKAEAA